MVIFLTSKIQAQLQKEEEEAAKRKSELEATREDSRIARQNPR